MSSLTQKIQAVFDTLNNNIDKKNSEINLLSEALAPFANFIDKFDQKPLKSMDDEFYTIHAGTEWEASLKLSDMRAAKKALESLGGVEDSEEDDSPKQMTITVNGEEFPVFNCDRNTNFITNSRLPGNPHISKCVDEARDNGFMFMSFNVLLYRIDNVGEPVRMRVTGGH